MFRCRNDAMSFQVPVYLEARNLAVERGAQSVLDIGCGNPQKLRAFLMPFVNTIVGLDLPEVVEKIDEPFGDWIGLDIEKNGIDLKQKFDIVIAADVIEHLSNPDGLFDIVMRHSDQESMILISTPERESLRDKENGIWLGNDQHKHEYSKEEMIALIEAKGLKIMKRFLYREDASVFSYVENVFVCKRREN